MNVRMIVATLVITMAIGQHVVSMAQPSGRGKLRHASPPAATAATPMGQEIQRWLADLRQSSLDRAFRRSPPPVWIEPWDDAGEWIEPWDDAGEGFEPWDQQHLAETPGCIAVSLAAADGVYQIEAALADEHGWRKYRTSGSREQIDQWLTEVPAKLRKAIERHLTEIDATAGTENAPALSEPSEPVESID